MCTNPLKGFINKNGYVVKVSRNAKYVRYVDGDYKSYFDNPLFDTDITEYIDLPCRKCNECLLTMRREWTVRAIAEGMNTDNMCFMTLTYNDEHLKMARTVDANGEIYLHPTLDHEHYQKFMRRLRNYYSDKKLRFFMCGEYGSRTFRPHYHAIIYGIGLKDIKDLKVWNRNKNGDLLYSSEWLSLNIWQNGHVIIGDCQVASCCYVAGYVDKKFNNIKGSKFYEMTDIIPPYVKSSNRPGLGRNWFDDNIDRYKSLYDYISVSLGIEEPIKLYLTENWKKKLDHKFYVNLDIDKYLEYDNDKIIYRQKFSDRRLEEILENTDMNKDEYLNSIEDALFRKSKRKVRDFV